MLVLPGTEFLTCRLIYTGLSLQSLRLLCVEHGVNFFSCFKRKAKLVSILEEGVGTIVYGRATSHDIAKRPYTSPTILFR